MATKFEQIEYTIPEWALCALINGDDSGLSDQDCADLDAFLSTVPGKGHWGYDSESESYFSWSNDVNSLGSNVVDMVWNQIVED
jgi:hypothetical protein